MKISFLGTGAAEGVPAMFCSCKYCQAIRGGAGAMRVRTQVLIDDKISLDFPPEAYYNSQRFGVDLSSLQYLLITHSHMDHFYAHDFILRGYRYAQLSAPVLNVYGNAEICKVFGECTGREMKPEVNEHLSVTRIKPYDEIEFGGYRVLALPAVHGTAEEALLYYIEKEGKGYLHLYDTGDFSDEAIAFLKSKGARAQAAAFDCTYLDLSHRPNARHMNVSDNLALKERLQKSGVLDGDCKVIISHFSHNSDPSFVRVRQIEREYGVTAAYDGFTICI